MTKKDTDKKDIIIIITILLVGAALTAASFCIYYLVKPRNTIVLAVLCVVDFLYNLFVMCFLIKYNDYGKWLLKGTLFAVGYIIVFIAIATLANVIGGSFEFLKNHIVDIVFYAFFTSPSMFIVIIVLALFFAYG